jgi:hypothetical protein
LADAQVGSSASSRSRITPACRPQGGTFDSAPPIVRFYALGAGTKSADSPMQSTSGALTNPAPIPCSVKFRVC